MPNYVASKLVFDAAKAEEVLAGVTLNGRVFDFEALVPSPPNMYHGNLSADDNREFKVNWSNWCVQNWGTKWNSHNVTTGIEPDGRAFIMFQTAWDVPYPIIAAFINRFVIPFELRYADEMPNFWGIDTFGYELYDKEMARVVRLKRDRDRAEDRDRLMLELFNCTDDDGEEP